MFLRILRLLLFLSHYNFALDAQDGYPFCKDGIPHSIAQINNNGQFIFHRQEKAGIACSVGLLIDPNKIGRILFNFDTTLIHPALTMTLKICPAS